MFSSTTFSSSRRRLQRANPSGAGEQVRAINLASAAPSKIRLRAEFGLCLRFSAASSPSSTSRRRRRPILLMLVSSATEIALSLQPSPASDTSALSRMRAFVSSCAGLLPARTRDSSRSRSSPLSRTTYFLTAISFPATNQLHRSCAMTEIQKNATESMTLTTSQTRPNPVLRAYEDNHRLSRVPRLANPHDNPHHLKTAPRNRKTNSGLILVRHRRCRPARHETVGRLVYSGFSVVGSEIGVSLVRLSPSISWIGDV